MVGPPARVSVGVDVDGRPVIVKHGTGPTAARLVREADALVAARHPGVVELLDRTVTPDGITLRTRHAGNRTVATCGPLAVAEVAGLVAALADTVADLHAAGIAHGRIRPEHVIVSTSGRPVLCGLAEARLAVAGAALAADVAGIGDVLTSLLAGPDHDGEVVPDRRPRWRPERDGAERRALLTLADHACHADPTRRPTARQLAASVSAAVPHARLPAAESPATAAHPVHPRHGHGPARRSPSPGTGRTGPDRPVAGRRHAPAPPGPRPRRAGRDAGRAVGVALALAAVLVVIALGAVLTTGLGRPAGEAPSPSLVTATADTTAIDLRPDETPRDPSDEPGPASGDRPTSTTVGPPDTAPDGPSAADPHDDVPPTAEQAAGCDTTPEGSATTAAGTPCPTSLALRDTVLHVGVDRFDLGGSAAGAAIGDWDCDGTATPVALADDGSVIVFDRWAGPADEVAGRAVTRVDGARRVLAEPAGAPGCHRLVVLDRWGLRHLADAGAAP